MNKRTENIMYQLPEYLLAVLAVFGGYTFPFSFNPFLMVIAFVLILQIIFKARLSGILLGCIIFFLNLYMLGALFSEFNEFPFANNASTHMLLVGLSLWTVVFISSGTMIYKYAKNSIGVKVT